jgi:hypothetical protein
MMMIGADIDRGWTLQEATAARFSGLAADIGEASATPVRWDPRQTRPGNGPGTRQNLVGPLSFFNADRGAAELCTKERQRDSQCVLLTLRKGRDTKGSLAVKVGANLVGVTSKGIWTLAG